VDDRPRGRPAVVDRVVDGDTIEVRFRGRRLTVRLIGVDTPESVHPTRPVECYGLAAAAFTERHLAGAPVRLELDVEPLDRYGRTLAYVWTLDGRLFNEVLIARGFATVATFPPNVRYVDRFVAAQRRARRADRGLWGACPLAGTGSSGGRGAGGSTGRCDPAYPDVCIPSPPPDLDCGDVRHRRFRVLPPDPHRFDGDGDGIGCET
jgi:micrococcal nuclease